MRERIPDLDKDTIIVEAREGLWRMLIYPDQIQLFRSRELCEANARNLALSRIAWTVIVREPETN
jgi:hypothetical protein